MQMYLTRRDLTKITRQDKFFNGGVNELFSSFIF